MTLKRAVTLVVLLVVYACGGSADTPTRVNTTSVAANDGQIGVLTVAGDIVDGEGGPGTAAGDKTTQRAAGMDLGRPKRGFKGRPLASSIACCWLCCPRLYPGWLPICCWLPKCWIAQAARVACCR